MNFALDIFFPPNETEKILRTISIEDLYKKCSKNIEINDSEIYSVFKYKDPFIKDSIYELKNNKNKYAIRLFSEILREEILNYLEENLINLDYKIPITFVPQHKSTYLNKGYNQSEELAAAIAAASPNIFEFKKLLKKVKKTKPQHEVNNRKARLNNLKGAFELVKSEKSKVKSNLIILIDDVYTTGATLKESRHVLLKSGASKVICFTIAH